MKSLPADSGCLATGSDSHGRRMCSASKHWCSAVLAAQKPRQALVSRSRLNPSSVCAYVCESEWVSQPARARVSVCVCLCVSTCARVSICVYECVCVCARARARTIGVCVRAR